MNHNERFKAFIKAASLEIGTPYAASWEGRFQRHNEWAYADLSNRRKLQLIDPLYYPVQIDMYHHHETMFETQHCIDGSTKNFQCMLEAFAEFGKKRVLNPAHYRLLNAKDQGTCRNAAIMYEELRSL
jgi:hypothetical protein